MGANTPKFSVAPVFLTLAVLLPLILAAWLLGGDSRVIGRGVMSLLICACCIGAYLTRKKPVGGYLFIFFFQLIVCAVMATGVASNVFYSGAKNDSWERPPTIVPKSLGSQWGDAPAKYSESLNDGREVKELEGKFDFIPEKSAQTEFFSLKSLVGLPFYLGTIVAAALSFLALSRRDKKHLRMLRITYLTLLVVSSLGSIVDWIYFKELLTVSIAVVIWTAIWCAYTFWSHRVEYVLGLGEWDFDKFSMRFNAIGTKELSKIKSYAFMSAIGTVLLFAVVMVIEGDLKADAGMAILLVPYPIVIGFSVQAVLLRRALNKLTPIQLGRVVDFEKKEIQRNVITRDRELINPRQRLVLGATGFFLAAAVLFPPHIINLPNGMVINGGFSFLFSVDSLALVNAGLLGLELLVIGILGFIGWLIGRHQ